MKTQDNISLLELQINEQRILVEHEFKQLMKLKKKLRKNPHLKYIGKDVLYAQYSRDDKEYDYKIYDIVISDVEGHTHVKMSRLNDNLEVLESIVYLDAVSSKGVDYEIERKLHIK